jgi:hypothetical protein
VRTTKTGRPETTLLRALIALAICSGAIALMMTASTASGWLANPSLGPHGVFETVLSVVAILGLWSFNIAAVLTLFAGGPWAILHRLGARSWWIAPLAGFVVAFGIAFFVTVSNAYVFPQLDTSAWIDGKATALNGRLTDYGVSIYGAVAAARNGAAFGVIGAIVGISLWRIAYRRKPLPDRATSQEARD